MDNKTSPIDPINDYGLVARAALLSVALEMIEQRSAEVEQLAAVDQVVVLNELRGCDPTHPQDMRRAAELWELLDDLDAAARCWVRAEVLGDLDAALYVTAVLSGVVH